MGRFIAIFWDMSGAPGVADRLQHSPDGQDVSPIGDYGREDAGGYAVVGPPSGGAMPDAYDIPARLAGIQQRLRARLPGVQNLELTMSPRADGPTLGTLTGRIGPEELVLRFTLDYGSNDDLVESVCALASTEGLDVLPEVVLTQDTVVVLNGHRLAVAEMQRVVSSTPRAPVDPSHGYTEELAEADVARVALALADWEPGSPWPDEQACIDASRPAAALLLSKLHCFKLGAPPESPGHAYARRVHDGDLPATTESEPSR